MSDKKSNKPVTPTVKPMKSVLVENSQKRPDTIRQPKPQQPKKGK
jgi:hypothetical protein